MCRGGAAASARESAGRWWWGAAWGLAMAAGCSLNTGGEWESDGGGTDADALDAGGEFEGGIEADGEGGGAECGNGRIDPGEACDDGSSNSDTEPGACRTDCTAFRCGDCVVDPGEACEPCLSPDDCGSDCRLLTCGDGTVDPGEACDDGDGDDADECPSNCQTARCGDGFVWAGHEACDRDPGRPCTSPCGSTGSQACADDCTWGVCAPPAESCNGLDDDCDTVPDDGFACARGAVRACTTDCGSTGGQACGSDCGWGGCALPPESCNGVDDNCDTVPDDGFACARGAVRACTTACGSTGGQACGSDCGWGACAPPAESCNGLDDDCDTVPDDGFACARGAVRACTTGCGTVGAQACGSDCAWGACAPPAESCNGLDDDCDTVPDDGFACVLGAARSCPTACGTTGSQACGSDCGWGACAPPVESCNGADDDCDTVPDDGLACVLGATSACTNACGAPGARTCGAGCAWSACCGAAEVCRTDCSRPACDDDCDGTTDEGCPPCNDACSAAVDISAGGDFPGTTVGAADDSVRCVAACGTGGRDVWYRFTLAAEEVVFLSLQGAVWDTVLDVRRGTSCGALAAQVCQDDACGGRQALWTGVLPAGTYYVVVDGCYEADSGPFTLRFRRSACPGAVRVSAPGTVSGTTCGAGNEHYAGTVCGGYNSPDVSHYVAMCPGSRTLSASTCDDGRGWRNNLEVRSGSGGVCGAAQVACQPPNCAWSSYTPYRSSLSASVAGNDLYFVVVDGYGPETCGQYALQLSW